MPLFIDKHSISDDDFMINQIADHRWYPIYCRPNKEYKMLKYAISQNIPCYLPEVKRQKPTRGQHIATLVPLFIGYVFLALTRQMSWIIKKSQYCIRVLPVDSNNEQVLIKDLNIVRKFELLAKKQKVEIRSDFSPGKRVVITAGCLKGCEGVIICRKSGHEIIVNLEFLGGSLATMEAYELELT